MWARLRAAIVARWTAVVSQEGAVVVLSANDLFWRLLADIRWRGAAEMLGTLADNLIVSASVSVLAGLQTEFRVIAVVAQWLLLLALFYALAPRIFRPEARDPLRALPPGAGVRTRVRPRGRRHGSASH